ncbi:hypothetical protein AB6813_01545 [bacterium RCC_150]
MKSAASLLPLLAGLIGSFRSDSHDIRSNMKIDAELLAKLPEDSSARTQLLELLEESVNRLKSDIGATRSLPQLAIAVPGGVGFVWLTFWLWQQGEWWQYLLAILAGCLSVFCIFGAFDAAEVRVREAKKFEAPRSEVVPPSEVGH